MLVINFLTKTENTYVSYILNLFNLLILVNSILQKNLYEINKYSFEKSKGRCGFYAYDGEYGYIEYDDVTHWLPLPELPKGVGHDER